MIKELIDRIQNTLQQFEANIIDEVPEDLDADIYNYMDENMPEAAWENHLQWALKATPDEILEACLNWLRLHFAEVDQKNVHIE